MFNSIIANLESCIWLVIKYSWSNNRVIPNLEKLDIILMSKEWEKLFPRASVHKHAREMSNHSLLF